jgi:hypothetical protein
LDNSIFHLDGPGAIKHLDSLLDVPELNAIQWVYGAGNGPGSKAEWIELYKRVQHKNKGLMISCVNVEDALDVARNIDPKGVFFFVSTEYEKQEAADFLKIMEDWTAGKKI